MKKSGSGIFSTKAASGSSLAKSAATGRVAVRGSIDLPGGGHIVTVRKDVMNSALGRNSLKK